MLDNADPEKPAGGAVRASELVSAGLSSLRKVDFLFFVNMIKSFFIISYFKYTDLTVFFLSNKVNKLLGLTAPPTGCLRTLISNQGFTLLSFKLEIAAAFLGISDPALSNDSDSD